MDVLKVFTNKMARRLDRKVKVVRSDRSELSSMESYFKVEAFVHNTVYPILFSIMV